jgi:hypothetical protein
MTGLFLLIPLGTTGSGQQKPRHCVETAAWLRGIART